MAGLLWLHILLPPGFTYSALQQKIYRTGAAQIENSGLMDRYLYTDAHEAIIPDEMFMAVQEGRFNRSRDHEKAVAIKLIF